MRLRVSGKLDRRLERSTPALFRCTQEDTSTVLVSGRAGKSGKDAGTIPPRDSDA